MKKTMRGFTVVELIVVVSIITILMTFIMPMIGKAKERARIAKAQTEIAALETAISAYYSDMGKYPTDRDSNQKVEDRNTFIIQQLTGRTGGTGTFDTTITSQSQWNGPYLELDAASVASNQFIDPWENPYVIEIDLDGDTTTTPPSHNALTIDITCGGPDGSDTADDNITNY